MVDKIDMSLDDIIKSNKGRRKPGNTRGRGRGGNRPGGQRRGGGGGFRGGQNRSGGGGVMKGRNRGGGITRQKYSRVRIQYNFQITK